MVELLISTIGLVWLYLRWPLFICRSHGLGARMIDLSWIKLASYGEFLIIFHQRTVNILKICVLTWKNHPIHHCFQTILTLCNSNFYQIIFHSCIEEKLNWLALIGFWQRSVKHSIILYFSIIKAGVRVYWLHHRPKSE